MAAAAAFTAKSLYGVVSVFPTLYFNKKKNNMRFNSFFQNYNIFFFQNFNLKNKQSPAVLFWMKLKKTMLTMHQHFIYLVQ